MPHDDFDRRQPARILPFPARPDGHARRGTDMSPITLRPAAGTTASAPAPTLTTIAGGLSTRRPSTTERGFATMTGTNIGISHMYASARHADFLSEAERARTINSARVQRGSRTAETVRSIRMRAGAAVIRFGERLRGAEEACADLGSFRAARS